MACRVDAQVEPFLPRLAAERQACPCAVAPDRSRQPLRACDTGKRATEPGTDAAFGMVAAPDKDAHAGITDLEPRDRNGPSRPAERRRGSGRGMVGQGCEVAGVAESLIK